MMTFKQAFNLLRVNLPWLLVVSCVPLFATKTLFNIPVSIMVAVGAIRFFKDRERYLHDPVFQWIIMLFLCFWIPMWLSLTDAVNLSRSLGNTISWLRFPVMAIFIMDTLRNRVFRIRIFYATAAVVGIWCLDAMIQYVAGVNLLGYPYEGGRLGGMFYPRLTLGTVTAALSPIYIEVIYRFARRTRIAWLGLVPLIAAIALAGNRTGWLMFALAILIWGVRWHLVNRKRVSRKGMVAIASALVLCVLVLMQSDVFKSRIDETLGLFSVDMEAIDDATSHRLSIWYTAMNMFGDHWINGVGPRGFRYDYMDHVDARDRLVHELHVDGATHPHLQVLEIAVETGVFGLAGLFMFWRLFYSVFRSVLLNTMGYEAVPWIIAAFAAAFPLNAHMSFYASYWSSIFWWLLIVSIAMSRPVLPGFHCWKR